MAVGEASAMVLEVADPGSELVSKFVLSPGEMTVAVSVGRRRRASRTTTASPGRC